MNASNWRQKTIDKLKSVLETDPSVLSLSVFGSITSPNIQLDEWSDIDALLVIENKDLKKFYPSTDWLKNLGTFFALQQASNKQGNITQVVFDDSRKLDLIITSKSQILKEEPFWTKQKFVFSNSEEIRRKLEQTHMDSKPLNLMQYDLEKLSNDFWFLSYTAVTKVIRNDLLIALHLALDLYRYCLLLGMWLRDRETGTKIHRVGGLKNDLIENMNIKIDDLSKKGILNFIEKCGEEFEKLALKWTPNYIEHTIKFKKILSKAQEDIYK